MFSWLANYKTTLSGISAVIAGVTLLANGQIGEGFAAIVSGIGLIAAADAKKGS